MPSRPGTASNNDSSDSQQSTASGSEQRAGNTGDTSGRSSQGWLEGEPVGGNNGQGEWQTSNQGIPENTGNPDADGGEDTAEVSGDDTKNGADQALAEALEGLDGEILAERAVLRETEAASNRGKTSTEEDATVKSSSTVASSSATTATRGRVNTPPPPPKRGDDAAATNLPDAKDDDIIARQLREAAMQETDPELKEKLWDEYRRYKKG